MSRSESNRRQPLGAHLSIAGGLHLALARAEALGCSALQIFTKNASQWRGKPLSPEDIAAWRSAWHQSPIGPVLAHASYLINLANPDEQKWERSIAALLDELDRCALLGIPQLILHPGAHLESGEAAGLERIGRALRRIDRDGPAEVELLLENTAGQGSCLGAAFEQLAALLAAAPNGRLGLCFDTCHAFAAGYDLTSAAGYAAVMTELERLIGLERLRVFHLNDAKKGLGCAVDRHEHIGQGAIGRAGFAALLQDQRFLQVPKILETPKGEDDRLDRMNLALLRELAGES
jgi:deoxyribonuclease IV